MIADFCDHQWRIANPEMVRTAMSVNDKIDLKFVCQKCALALPAKEVYQIESLENQSATLRHLKGFQAKATIVSLIISITAILIAIFSN